MQAFNAVDTDMDGFLDAEEVGDYLEEQGVFEEITQDLCSWYQLDDDKMTMNPEEAATVYDDYIHGLGFWSATSPDSGEPTDGDDQDGGDKGGDDEPVYYNVDEWQYTDARSDDWITTFNSLDTDQDGVISFTELNAFLEASDVGDVDVWNVLNRYGDHDWALNSLEAARAYDDYVNVDGIFNPEGHSGYHWWLWHEDERFEKIFSQLDTNGDGAIDAAELREFLESTDLGHLHPERVEAVMDPEAILDWYNWDGERPLNKEEAAEVYNHFYSGTNFF